MAAQHDSFDEKISFEEYLALVEKDPEHGSVELTSLGIHFSVAEAYQDTSLVPNA